MEEGEYRKYRTQTGNGKGDAPRPVDANKFRKNYDAINWGRKKQSVGVVDVDAFHLATRRLCVDQHERS